MLCYNVVHPNVKLNAQYFSSHFYSNSCTYRQTQVLPRCHCIDVACMERLAQTAAWPGTLTAHGMERAVPPSHRLLKG